jgi:hypothetical protein
MGPAVSPLAPLVPPPEAQPVRSVRIEAPVQQRPVIGDRAEGPAVYKVEAPDASPWYGEALDRISGLTALAVGWNGHDAREVKADMAIDAAKFLAKVAFPGIAAPSITPLAEGGLQVEWHRGGLDIEVAFTDDEPGVYIVEREGGEVELPLAEAVSAITSYWPRLQDS